MVEIIPNWHPIFVHFTVGLLSISVFFYILAYLSDRFNIISSPIKTELEIAARWCLWSGAIITILTVIAGFFAYNSVAHDMPSHYAMQIHRNWALSTATVAVLIAFWSFLRYIKQKALSINLILVLLLMQGLLLSTAWRGGELVYRYGLGVRDLPDSMDSSMRGKVNTHSMDSVGSSMKENLKTQPTGTNSPNSDKGATPAFDESSPHNH